MLQISPGRFPDETQITITEACPGPLDGETLGRCEETMAVNLNILKQEDFPAPESGQQGYDGGAVPMIDGVGETLIGFWHIA